MKQTGALGVRNLWEMICHVLRACIGIVEAPECGPSCGFCNAPFPWGKISPRLRKPGLDVGVISDECIWKSKRISRRKVSGDDWR